MSQTISVTTIVIDVACDKAINEPFFAYRVAVGLKNLISEFLPFTITDMNLTNRFLFACEVGLFIKSSDEIKFNNRKSLRHIFDLLHKIYGFNDFANGSQRNFEIK